MPSRELDNSNTNFVPAMFDNLNAISVIGNGSFYRDLSVHPYFTSKYCVWQCMIDRPAVEFIMKVSSLIDNSSHMVLIHPQLDEKLVLPIFTLLSQFPTYCLSQFPIHCLSQSAICTLYVFYIVLSAHFFCLYFTKLFNLLILLSFQYCHVDSGFGIGEDWEVFGLGRG